MERQHIAHGTRSVRHLRSHGDRGNEETRNNSHTSGDHPMNRVSCCLVATWLLAAAAACPLAAAEADKGLANPFFAFSVKVPDKVLEDLGYAPIHNFYPAVHLDKSPAYAPDLKDEIQKLQGTNTIFWLTIHGKRT